ncbi:MAG: mechanosensitive ion channel domain-containing protein [Gammaproteobacteria bacterium]|jgi:small-conductance mechanosensitive channel
MSETFNLDALLKQLTDIALQVQAVLKDPTFWPQFVIIIVVFAIARWLLTPLIHRFLDLMMKYTQRAPHFRRLWSVLRDISNPIAWLFLQWLAIHVAAYLELRTHALVTVVSLLTAWVLIRLASALVQHATIARIIAISAWSVAALNIFGLLDETMVLLDSWSINIGQIRLSPLSVLRIIFSLWIALWLATALSSLLEKRLERSKTTNASTRVLISKLTRISLVLAAILIALSSVGIDLTALAIFSGALGVGLGFGLQKIFSNLVSGIILLMDKSIKPGDVISLGTTFGWINYLGLRYTSVITRDGIEHLIPNEELITQRVENWSFSDNLVRLKAPIGISYNSDVRLAMKLCIEAAEIVPRVELAPEPRVQLMGFGDSSVNLELRIWIDDPQQGRANILSEVLLNVWDKFHEHGITIPFPQRDLHVKSVLGETELAALRMADNKQQCTHLTSGDQDAEMDADSK